MTRQRALPKLDAPRRRGAIAAWTENHDETMGGLAFFTGLVTAVVLIVLIVMMLAYIGPDSGDEAPHWVPVLLAGWITFWVSSVWWAVGAASRHTVEIGDNAYSPLSSIYILRARLEVCKDESIKYAADNLYKDLVLLMRAGGDYEREPVRARLDALSALADEADRQAKVRVKALVSDASLEHANDVIEASRAARKELAP